jgi:hypothetical protein
MVLYGQVFYSIRHKYHVRYNPRIPDEQLVTSALICAYNCDKLDIFSVEHIRYLDKLDQSLIGRYISQAYWASSPSLRDIPSTADEIPIIESFVDLAAVYQISKYVQLKLSLQSEMISPLRASALLRLCLPFRERNYSVILPHPNPKLVSLLLRYGARPNLKYSGYTSWRNALRLLRICSAAHRSIVLDLLEIALLLLKSGAYPKAEMKIGATESISAWRIIASLKETYPEPVQRIQDELLRLAPDIDQRLESDFE